MGVGHREILRALLGSFLEHLVGIQWHFAFAVLQTPSAEPCGFAVIRVTFHTGEEVYNVIFVEHIVVGDGES